MARPAVDDAVSSILEDYGYAREDGWHDPQSVIEVIELEGWGDFPNAAPGACLSCFEVHLAELPASCDCGGEVRSILSLAGYE